MYISSRRRLYCLCLCLLTLACCVPCTAWSGNPPLLKHELTLHIQPDQQLLTANDVITLEESSALLPTLFRLAEEAVIESVRIDGVDTVYRFSNGRLEIPDAAHGGSRLRIAYRARFTARPPENTVGIEDPSFGISATITGQGTFLGGNAAWLPLSATHQAIHDLTVIGPPGLIGVTSGRLMGIEHGGEQTTTRWSNRVPQATLALAAGFYQVAEEMLNGLQVLVFLSADNASLAPRYLDACRRYLAFYQELFGPYPYAKFAVVENFFPTGYGLPGWTLLGSSVIRLPFILTTSLPHEIAHVWWGNAVKVDYDSGNWGEGLATYVADYLLIEQADSGEAMEQRRKLLRDYATLVDDGNDYPLREFRGRMHKRDQAIGYGKAAMVFHMLRRKLGDGPFWQGLRHIAREDAGAVVSWQDLQGRFEAVAQQDLSRFFSQWVDRAGAPQLTLAEVRVEPAGAAWTVSGVVRQQAPCYELDLPLRLSHSQGTREMLLEIDGCETRFHFPSSQRPTRLVADPDSHLFRRLIPEEIPVTINALRTAEQRLVVIAEGADPGLLRGSTDLLRGLHWHQAPVVEEAELTAEQRANADLLFIGWPGRGELPVALPRNLAVDRQGFAVDDIIFQKPHDALFLVLARSGGARGVIGIFHPLSPAAARDVARRISHYGRYSYLAFSNGSNRLKGTWLPGQSPLQFIFE